MSDDQDIICEDSSSNTSSIGSFENVSATDDKSSAPLKISNDDVPDKEAINAELDKQSIDAEITESVTVEHKECREEKFYTSIHAGRAISNLVKFSAAMFVLPLLVMFTMYHYVFRDYCHLPPDEAMLYAGFCGVAVVIIITIVFICVAYHEEQEDEKIKLYTKKSE